jgi:phosphoribosylformylglycinamidine cyclo-ligase
MFRVFNMGIGYVLMVAKEDVESTMDILNANDQEAIIVGEVVAGSGKSVLIN